MTATILLTFKVLQTIADSATGVQMAVARLRSDVRRASARRQLQLIRMPRVVPGGRFRTFRT